MHDPKFEEEVQQKMAELEFSPSESVWANVEAAINKRRRWRLPLFWRFALPGLLLLAGGAYYFAARNPNGAMTATNSTANKTTLNTPNTTLNSNNTTPDGAAAATHSDVLPAEPSAHSTNSAAAGRPREGSVASATPARRETGTDRNPSRDPFTAAAKKGKGSTAGAGRMSDGGGIAGRERRANDDRASGEDASQTSGEDASQASDRVADAGRESRGDARPGAPFNPALASLHSGLSPVKAGQLASRSTVSKIQTPRHPWEAAFTGGAGLSTLHQMNIANYGLAQSDIRSSQTTVNAITTYAARPTKEEVSTVDPGPSFFVGVLAQKWLSPRWSFSAGLDFHYYSNRVRVGQQVSGYTPSTATYLTAMSVAPIQSYPYYSRGNVQSYMNRYYFVELPVAIEWKVNRSHLLPIFLDGGFSAAYLMGSSAVYYNTHSGVYFKDAGVANKMQLNLNSAIMVGLPLRGLRVQLGPQIQYGLTPLLNTNVSGAQHIFYGGIRLVVLPGKK